jgi:peroxiredoxin
METRQKAYFLGLAYAARGNAAKLSEQIVALKAVQAKDNGAAPALAELEGYELLAKGDIGPAFDRFAKASGMRPEALARAHFAARNFGLAVSTAKSAVEKQPDQLPPLAALVEILQADGKVKEAQEAYARMAPLARTADPDLPVFQRLAPAVESWKASGWNPPKLDTPTDVVTAVRPPLPTLGPLTWSPFPAEPFTMADTKDQSWSLADRKGKSNVVVLFSLGGKCAHCMQQLQLFGKENDALKALNTEVVALSTDDAEATRKLKENAEGVKFPMAMLADPKLEVFKRYRAYDDFEDRPLHATILIDAAGNVRFQRISSDPFLDVDFIKAEAARVNGLLRRGGESGPK